MIRFYFIFLKYHLNAFFRWKLKLINLSDGSGYTYMALNSFELKHVGPQRSYNIIVTFILKWRRRDMLFKNTIYSKFEGRLHNPYALLPPPLIYLCLWSYISEHNIIVYILHVIQILETRSFLVAKQKCMWVAMMNRNQGQFWYNLVL